MYDEFDDCWYPAEDNYHEDLRQIAEEEERQYLDDEEPTSHEDDGDYDDLLDELDFPF
tara:strand:+ start:477 stop:650 length:174 start_codon:yes stop_codon:yes gene_type:complete